MQAIFETAFDIIYLVSVITLGIIIVKDSRGNRQFSLFGIMAIVLGAGDAFHLFPRAVALCTTELESYTAALGFGKLVTSITMTVFLCNSVSCLAAALWKEGKAPHCICLCSCCH